MKHLRNGGFTAIPTLLSMAVCLLIGFNRPAELVAVAEMSAVISLPAPDSDMVSSPVQPAGRAFGNNAQEIGKIIQPVNTIALVYRADMENPVFREISIVPGVWLVPERVVALPSLLERKSHE